MNICASTNRLATDKGPVNFLMEKLALVVFAALSACSASVERLSLEDEIVRFVAVPCLDDQIQRMARDLLIYGDGEDGLRRNVYELLRGNPTSVWREYFFDEMIEIMLSTSGAYLSSVNSSSRQQFYIQARYMCLGSYFGSFMETMEAELSR